EEFHSVGYCGGKRGHHLALRLGIEHLDQLDIIMLPTPAEPAGTTCPDILGPAGPGQPGDHVALGVHGERRDRRRSRLTRLAPSYRQHLNRADPHTGTM